MKKILLGLFAIMATLASCTDQEKIEIAYKADMTISASHIFSSFTPVKNNDFAMKGTENGDWDLNLHAFIYDDNGKLVKKVEEQFPSLSGTLNFDHKLLPGKYSVIAIADFTGIVNGENCRYWTITNEENLSDLTIDEVESIYSTVFETLGITSKEFEVGKNPEKLAIDIQPVTGLVQTCIWVQSMIPEKGTPNGLSMYAPYCESIEIFAPDLKRVVKFEGTKPTYKFGAQAYDYRIQYHSPKSQYEKNENKDVFGYRALLPVEDRDFYWEMTFAKGYGQFFGMDDFNTSDMTTKINIESGKQYVMDLLLDAAHLYVDQHNPAEDTYQRIQKLIDEKNTENFQKIMDRNFDMYIGISKDTVEKSFGKGYLEDNTLYIMGYNDYLQLICFGLDPMTEKVTTITVFFQYLNDDFRKRMTDYLSNRFTVYEKGTDTYFKAFIDGTNLESSKIGITWNLDLDMLTYVKLK